jgi:hypothetical protein
MTFESKRGQDEKNEKKKIISQFEKTNFFYCSFLASFFWHCIVKMICRAWEGSPITF